jgi:hypothetical protein
MRAEHVAPTPRSGLCAKPHWSRFTRKRSRLNTFSCFECGAPCPMQCQKWTGDGRLGNSGLQTVLAQPSSARKLIACFRACRFRGSSISVPARSGASASSLGSCDVPTCVQCGFGIVIAQSPPPGIIAYPFAAPVNAGAAFFRARRRSAAADLMAVQLALPCRSKWYFEAIRRQIP